MYTAILGYIEYGVCKESIGFFSEIIFYLLQDGCTHSDLVSSWSVPRELLQAFVPMIREPGITSRKDESHNVSTKAVVSQKSHFMAVC